MKIVTDVGCKVGAADSSDGPFIIQCNFLQMKWTQSPEAASLPLCETFAEVDQHLQYWTDLFNYPTETILK